MAIPIEFTVRVRGYWLLLSIVKLARLAIWLRVWPVARWLTMLAVAFVYRAVVVEVVR